MLKSLLFASIVCASSAYANIVINGTRVIYPSDQSSISVQLRNMGDAPSLVQVWLDDGNREADPATLKLPFVMTPPVSRVEAGASQMVRLRHTGQTLPNDRESLYYFNVLEIPPKPITDDNNPNYLQLTLRSRLKFFYRPAKLPYSVNDAYAKVTWQLAGNTLTASNPTPYYITYNGIALMQADKMVAELTDADMVAPFSQRRFSLAASVAADSVAWQIINDYGGYYESSSPVVIQSQ